MALAIFDLDNTLLRGDSDYLWGIYLIDKEAVDAEQHRQENERFYEQYLAGQMLSLIHISEPTRRTIPSRMPSSA